MPNRILRVGMLTSEAVARLTGDEHRLFTSLLLAVDDFGRFDGRPAVIRGTCFPLHDITNADVHRWLLGLARAGLVDVYEVDGRAYLQIEKWRERVRAQESRFPPPPPPGSRRPQPPEPVANPAQLLANAVKPEQPPADARTCAQLPADVSKCPQPSAPADNCAQMPASARLDGDGDGSGDGDDQEHSSGCEPDAPPPVLTSPTPKAPDPRDAVVTAVLEHWRERSGMVRAAIEGAAARKRRARVRQRLDEGFTLEQLRRACDGATRDPWLMGTDPKARPGGYRDVDTWLRDGPQVERLIALADGPAPAPRSRPANSPESRHFSESYRGVEPTAEDLAAVERVYGAAAPEAA